MLKAVSALDTRRGSRPQRDRLAFTLIEVLVATGLTLLIMSSVAAIFVMVTDNVSGARANIELAERLRATQNVLQHDLFGLTARGILPLDPASGKGYVEIIEGPVGPCGPPDTVLITSTGTLDTNDPKTPAQARSWNEAWDTSVGDYDDILQFTTRSTDVPFTGRGGPNPALMNLLMNNGQITSQNATQIVEAQSNVAEVSWFVRGRTLYRRVLLVDPTFNASFYNSNSVATANGQPQVGYYQICDVSARQVGGTLDPTVPSGTMPAQLVANSLGDLTKRENRYAHPPMMGQVTGGGPLGPAAQLATNWPHDARFWGGMRMPTLRESSDPKWPLPFYAMHGGNVNTAAGVVVPSGVPVHPNGGTFTTFPTVYFPVDERVRYDAWNEPRQWSGIDTATGGLIDSSATPATGDPQTPLLYPGSRYADDVILTNVVGFDVKVWDPGAPIFQRLKQVGVQSTGPKEVVTVAPGDPAYFDALSALFTDASDGNVDPTNMPVSYGAFVDLGWAVDKTGAGLYYPPSNWPPATLPPGYVPSQFAHTGNIQSGLQAIWSDQTVASPAPDFRARVYDTGSSHYERDGVDQGDATGNPRIKPRNGVVDEGTDGLDNDSANGIDDIFEREAPPPYDAELKAIQVKIRVFEPDSRQVREVTVVQEFVSQ